MVGLFDCWSVILAISTIKQFQQSDNFSNMKIRIQGNSIRLRLSQSEVQAFAETGRVEDRIQFGSSSEEALAYVMERANVRHLGASYAPNQIKIFVPAESGSEWATTDLVGMESEMDLGDGNSLRILVEKDFKCLTERAGEDESDNFPNPNVSC
jgi:hypothetical protein